MENLKKLNQAAATGTKSKELKLKVKPMNPQNVCHGQKSGYECLVSWRMVRIYINKFD